MNVEMLLEEVLLNNLMCCTVGNNIATHSENSTFIGHWKRMIVVVLLL